MFVVANVVCCQVEVSARSRSLVRRSPTDCGAACDLETSRMSRPWPVLGRSAAQRKKGTKKGMPIYSFIVASGFKLCIVN